MTASDLELLLEEAKGKEYKKIEIELEFAPPASEKIKVSVGIYGCGFDVKDELFTTTPPTESTTRTEGTTPPTDSTTRTEGTPPPTESTTRTEGTPPPTESTTRTEGTPPPTESTTRTEATPPPTESTTRTEETPPPTESTTLTEGTTLCVVEEIVSKMKDNNINVGNTEGSENYDYSSVQPQSPSFVYTGNDNKIFIDITTTFTGLLFLIIKNSCSSYKRHNYLND